MKNTFKFFSLMMVAGALLFASCTKEPEKPVTPKYTINVTANDNTMGTVTGGGVYDSASTITITATPNEGYVFVNWNDGNNLFNNNGVDRFGNYGINRFNYSVNLFCGLVIVVAGNSKSHNSD